MPIDPQKAGDYGTLLGSVLAGITFLVTAVTAPFKVFPTKRMVEATFVKKVEPDGTRAYVHPEEWEEMKKRMDASIKQGEKWQALVKDWLGHP